MPELDGLEVIGDVVDQAGWRLERNSNGYYRWRWQRKTADGGPVVYKGKDGKTKYKRGSKYIGKIDEG